MTILFATLTQALAYLLDHEPGLVVERYRDCVMGECWKVSIDNH